MDPQIISDKNKCFEGTFRKAIWPLLIIGQFFGVMPLIGVAHQSLSHLNFKWNSVRTVYALVIALVFVFDTVLLFWRKFDTLGL